MATSAPSVTSIMAQMPSFSIGDLQMIQTYATNLIEKKQSVDQLGATGGGGAQAAADGGGGILRRKKQNSPSRSIGISLNDGEPILDEHVNQVIEYIQAHYPDSFTESKAVIKLFNGKYLLFIKKC